ncbi:MAG: ABC transporter permease, partial [Stackebrandtia sp.]
MNSTIARLTAVNSLRKWRGVLLALLPAAMLLLAFAIRALAGDDENFAVGALETIAMGAVVPLVALIVATGAISTEIDDGAIVYLLTKPIPRWKISLTKLAVAVGSALVFGVIPTAIAAIILTGEIGAVTLGFAVAAVIASLVYCAVFLVLGVLSRSAVVIGLMYVLLWEHLIAGLVDGAKILSVQHLATSIASGMYDVLPSAVDVAVAAAISAVVAAAAAWYAGRR